MSAKKSTLSFDDQQDMQIYDHEYKKIYCIARS